MKFLNKLFGKSDSYVPYTKSNVDIVGMWIHQESTNTFYHHFYYIDKKLRYDTFQVVYPNKLGFCLTASDITWNGKTLKATTIASSGFKLRLQVKIKGDLLTGSINSEPITIRKLPSDIAEKEIANLKELGAPLQSTQ